MHAYAAHAVKLGTLKLKAVHYSNNDDSTLEQCLVLRCGGEGRTVADVQQVKTHGGPMGSTTLTRLRDRDTPNDT